MAKPDEKIPEAPVTGAPTVPTIPTNPTSPSGPEAPDTLPLSMKTPPWWGAWQTYADAQASYVDFAPVGTRASEISSLVFDACQEAYEQGWLDREAAGFNIAEGAAVSRETRAIQLLRTIAASMTWADNAAIRPEDITTLIAEHDGAARSARRRAARQE